MLTFFTIYHCLDEEFLQKASKIHWQDILSYIEVIYIYDDYCLLYLLKLENINNLKNLFIKFSHFFKINWKMTKISKKNYLFILNVELHPYFNVLKTINFVEKLQAFCAIKNSKGFL
jgi:hypothetical protein